MRPIRLEVEGFTCYRDRQEPLEFAGLSLFAISGPTGAGKSSILDTMLYALYGEIPRIGKQGIGEVISQGRDVLSVCLDFSVRGSTYRVARSVKRGKKGALTTTVSLAEITGGERNIADQVRPVNEAVVKLLGLDYSAFTQTVVLPQGEFARFLKSDPKGQREILQHLLRHDVFQRMREEAEKRRAHVDADLRGVERQVSEHEGHTEEVLAAKGLELASARQCLERASEERTALDLQAQESRRLRQLTEEFSRLKKDQASIDARESEIAQVRTELDLARRAAGIAPRLDAFSAAGLRSKQAQKQRDDAAENASDVTRRQAAAQLEATAAAEAAQECGELSERIRSIDEIKGDLYCRRTLTVQVEKLTKEMPVAQTQAALARSRLEAAATAADDARRGVSGQQAAVNAIAYDEQLHVLIEGLWTRVVQARAMGEEIGRLEQEHQALEAAHAMGVQHESSARRAHDEASLAADQASLAVADATAALTDGQTRYQAATLRAHLHAGEDCPVCLQQVASVPAVEAPPELAALAQRRSAADAHLEKVRQASQAAGKKLAAAEARRVAAASGADTSTAKLRERSLAKAQLQAEIVAALAQTAGTQDATDPLAWIETSRAELGEAKQARGRAESLLRVAESAVQRTAGALLKADTDSVRADENHARLEQQRVTCATELEVVSARIQSVSSHADPAVERNELATRVVALQTQERTTRATLADLQQASAGAAAALTAARAMADATETDLSTFKLALDEALDAAGFSSEGDANAATRTEQQQAELDATVRKHDDARVVVSQRLVDLNPQIIGKEVDAKTLADIEKRCSDATHAWRDAGLVVSRLDGERSRLAAAVNKRTQLIVERDALRARHSVTSEIALDLKGDAFQEYLLEEAFRGLVTGASVRMREISNRYTLEWDAGDFYVVDHDNAGERRRAETLSGGETFMASLCLALQLSDEVLRTSGALQMDSLFIDEGFGTLDSDSLSEVTDAMEALRQEGGRLIGVISHRPELTDRLPGCIRVDKGAGESRWSVERVG